MTIIGEKKKLGELTVLMLSHKSFASLFVLVFLEWFDADCYQMSFEHHGDGLIVYLYNNIDLDNPKLIDDNTIDRVISEMNKLYLQLHNSNTHEQSKNNQSADRRSSADLQSDGR